MGAIRESPEKKRRKPRRELRVFLRFLYNLKEKGMKQNLKRLIAIVLIIVMLSVLSSCKIHIIEFGWTPPFPNGYTGGTGFIQPESGIEVYLFETYDELMSAINSLKSHGSTFYERSILNCEEDEFDVKYMLVLNAFQSDKIIKYGDDPFDRCAKDVSITNVIFFEDVTVEELSYSHTMLYDCYVLHKFYNKDSILNAKSNPDMIESELYSDELSVYYRLSIDGQTIGEFENNQKNYTELTKEHFEKIIESIEFIGFDD